METINNDDKRPILRKLLSIYQEVDYLQKKGRNQKFSYNYASEKDVKEAYHAALTKHGVIFKMDTFMPTIQESGQTSSGGTTLLQFLPCKYTFWDVESGVSIEGDFLSCAHIRDDKGTFSASTSGVKYIFMNCLFLLPTGDDVESVDDRDGVASPTNTMDGGSVTSKQWEMIAELRKSREIPESTDADLTAWASGTGQTIGDASNWITTLKALPKKPKEEKPDDERAALIARIKAGEPIVYPVKTAIAAAHAKYLGGKTVDEADTFTLKFYLDHLLVKAKEKK